MSTPTVDWTLSRTPEALEAEGLRERRKRLMRQQLSDTATQMFLERGFDDVRVTEIAEACGVSEKTVFNYFPTKESLILDRLESTVASLRTGLAEPGTPPVEAALRILDDELSAMMSWLAAQDDPVQAGTMIQRFGLAVRPTQQQDAGRGLSVLLGEVGLVMTAQSLWRDAAWAGAAGWLAWDRDRERGGTMSGDLADLARRLSPGAVVTDEGVIEGYRRDRAATVPAGRPRAVVRPGTVAEVSSTLRWAAGNAVPVVPRGAGTGLSGGANAIDGCLMLSLERFTAIREINMRHQCAVVEAGVLNADLGRAAAAAGMFYPPDPGSFEICTIGGNLATNAGGMRCVKYGVTRDSALGLEVVLADGTVLRTGSGARKDVAGYDLTSLFIGSEGTLGVITSATLRIRPRPPRDPVTFVASFPALAAIGHAVDAIQASGVVPSMLELIDQATVNVIEDYRRMDLDRCAAGLLIGQADGAAADDEVRRMTRCCEEAGADLVVQATTAEESDLLLEARRLAGTAVMAAGPTVIEDVCVRPGQLAEMLAAVQEVSAGSGIPIATVAHAGDGNLHPVLMLPDLGAETVARAMAAGERLCDHARLLGGTVTGEHGVGVLKQAWLRQQLGPASLAVHQAIKTALDPAGILNPGRSF